MNNVGSLSEMVNSSIAVLTQPSVSTFERFERRGNLQNALIYVAIGAVISGVVGLLAGLILNTPGGAVYLLISGIITTLISFLVFTYSVFFIGKTQGGTGTYDEVAYTFSLFSVPLSVIGSILSLIPCLNILAAFALLIVQGYFGYLAVQSSMNLRDTGKAIITLVASVVLTIVVLAVVGAVLGGIFAVGAAVTS